MATKRTSNKSISLDLLVGGLETRYRVSEAGEVTVDTSPALTKGSRENGANKKGDTPEVMDLAKSISEVGLLEPPLVTPTKDGKYLIVYGYRRIAAVKSLGWAKVECRVRTLSEKDARMASFTENVQRQNNTVPEKVRQVANLSLTGWTDSDIAKALGVSPNYPANLRRAWAKLSKAQHEEWLGNPKAYSLKWLISSEATSDNLHRPKGGGKDKKTGKAEQVMAKAQEVLKALEPYGNTLTEGQAVESVVARYILGRASYGYEPGASFRADGDGGELGIEVTDAAREAAPAKGKRKKA